MTVRSHSLVLNTTYEQSGVSRPSNLNNAAEVAQTHLLCSIRLLLSLLRLHFLAKHRGENNIDTLLHIQACGTKGLGGEVVDDIGTAPPTFVAPSTP